MRKQLFILISVVLLLNTKTHADILEMSAGTTFNRVSDGDNGTVLNLAYIDTDHKYPIEYSIGHITGSKNLSGDLSKNQIYINVGLRKYWGNVFLGLGLNLVSETNDRLGTALNIKSELGYSYKHFVLKAAHISNANIKRPNNGDNFITLGYTKKF